MAPDRATVTITLFDKFEAMPISSREPARLVDQFVLLLLIAQLVRYALLLLPPPKPAWADSSARTRLPSIRVSDRRRAWPASLRAACRCNRRSPCRSSLPNRPSPPGCTGSWEH